MSRFAGSNSNRYQPSAQESLQAEESRSAVMVQARAKSVQVLAGPPPEGNYGMDRPAFLAWFLASRILAGDPDAEATVIHAVNALPGFPIQKTVAEVWDAAAAAFGSIARM